MLNFLPETFIELKKEAAILNLQKQNVQQKY